MAADAGEGTAEEGEDVERELLIAARNALGAKHVIRVCSSELRGEVNAALRRLADHAGELRAMLDFSGVSLAIDDQYHLWDSGFVSIPHDFELASFARNLKALEAGTDDAAPEPASSGAEQSEV